MTIDVVEMLRQTGFAEGLTEEELELIVPICHERSFSKGQEIFSEASLGRELYMVCKGRVSLEVALPNRPGRRAERLATAEPGTVFGEISLVDGSPRSAQARALDDTQVIVIMNEDISKVMDKNSRIGYIIMRNLATVLSTRLRNTNIWLRNELLWSR